MALDVLATSAFSKSLKKLHHREKMILDQAVQAILVDPAIGEEKKGDLSGVFVYKFKLNQQEMLLSYRLQADKFTPKFIMLLSLGSHKNFYRNLKRLD